MDPNDETPNGQTPDPAAAAAAGAETAPPPSAPDPTPDESALAAFEKGVAEATDPAAAPAPAAAAGGEGDGAAPPAAAGDKPKGEGAAAAPAKPDKPEGGKPEGEAGKDQAVEDEIKSLGLKERAAERFRELTTRVAEIEPLRQRAARADEWEQTVLSTGANPEQFGAALTYLRDINSGDPAKMRTAYEQLTSELKTLGEMLGMPAPGVDPLDAHPDLKAAVEAADLDRKHAEELAAARQGQRLQQAAAQRTTSSVQQQAAIEQGTAEVKALGAQLRAADPASFEAKSKLIAPMVNRIQKSLSPDQWAAAIKEQWDVLPAIPAPAPKPPPSAQPLRPTGASAGQMRKPQNDVEAFDFGVASAKAAGL